ncbi:MAG: bifunctional serine/threonine-protein kinase/formylglycine-generating enzyme family protein [Candidatus Contendobacter sp.]|nr:bifunctional serine/threonine-protein kinase/formylglycine-generating enzyme family protein [Candidatus Contendobacter sp.]
MDRATHCPNCFQEPAPAPRCSHCGFDAASYLETNEILPLFTTLAGGKYRVGRVLGRGGFAVVYAGFVAKGLKRKVAVKEFFPRLPRALEASRQGVEVTVPKEQAAAFETQKKRFLLEAEILAQFRQPRLVQIDDSIEENNTIYLIMERLTGHTLSEHLGGLWDDQGGLLKAARALPPEDVSRLLYAALEGLEVLHGHAPPVIHRDLTPNNLFLEGEQVERLKVLDFGLARLGIAKASILAGTLDFAAPEQLGYYGRHITPATDFYTLGASLYTALTGLSPPGAIQRHAKQPPKPLSLPPSVDSTLAQVIRACLEIDPEKRPQSVTEIRQRLAAGTVLFPDPEPLPPPPLTQPPPEPAPFQVFRDRLRDGTEGPAMIVIPAGTVLIEFEVKGRRDPAQEECKVGSFAIGQYAVTFAEYDRFCDATGREKPDDAGWGREMRPAINVSLDDVDAYIDWLSQETGQRYRLPDDTEWEYAARAGTKTAFWWGNQIASEQANFDNNYGKTVPVNNFKPNPWGLYQVHGNIWEITIQKNLEPSDPCQDFGLR